MPPLYDQFILFGDSITQQCGSTVQSALQDAYMRKLDVINRGFSGYNTRQALKVLPTFLPSPDQGRIRFITIFLGANDAAGPWSNQHIPLAEYESNLEKIIKHPSIAAHSPRIILIAPPPVDERLQEAQDLERGKPQLNRLAAITKCYADAAVRVGAKLDVPVLNLWKLFMAKAEFNADSWKEGSPLPGSREMPQNNALVDLMFDGLHFNPPAYKLLFDALIGLIEEQWPDQAAEKLPPALPLWDDTAAWVQFD